MQKPTLLLLAAILIVCPMVQAQFAGTGTTTVSVTVGAEAALQVTTSTTTLTATGSIFNDYTGTTNLTYKIRTASGGNGTITAKVTADFSPTGGPSVGTPPTSGDKLAYTCTVSTPGTACTGSQTSSTASDSPVATFGAGAHSTAAGNSARPVLCDRGVLGHRHLHNQQHLIPGQPLLTRLRAKARAAQQPSRATTEPPPVGSGQAKSRTATALARSRVRKRSSDKPSRRP